MIITELIKDKNRHQEYLEAPMLSERESYLEYLRSKGYKDDYLKKTSLFLLRIISAKESQDLKIYNINFMI